MKVAKSGEPDQRHSISRFILHHNETRDAVRERLHMLRSSCLALSLELQSLFLFDLGIDDCSL